MAVLVVPPSRWPLLLLVSNRRRRRSLMLVLRRLDFVEVTLWLRRPLRDDEEDETVGSFLDFLVLVLLPRDGEAEEE